MAGKDSDTNLYAFLVATVVLAVLLYRYLTEIQKFEYNTKAFLLSIFTLSNDFIILSVLLAFLIIKKIINRRRAKREAREWEEQIKMFKKENLKERRITREKEIKEEEERIELDKIQTKLLQEKYPIRKVKLTESKITYGQKAYVKKELDESDLAFLNSEGFIHVREKSLDEKEKYYLVLNDKFESPRHIILVKEIVDYLMRFTKEIETYRTTMPDIVFTCNEIKYAIEVETGTNLRDNPKIKNKIRLLKERFGKNWFFFVTNRNLEKEYAKFGKVSTKRNIKLIIKKIFKNS
jgi:hypothetical protein